MRPLSDETNTTRPREVAQQRQHRLGHRDLADDVDLELTAQVVERHALHRAGHDDAGVVDDGVEAAGQCRGQRGDLVGVGHVEHDRRDALGRERVAVLAAAHAGDDVPPGGREMEGGGASDPARGTGDEHGRHAGGTYRPRGSAVRILGL